MLNKINNHKGKVLGNLSDIQVIDCNICKFAHIIPIPKLEDLVRTYKDQFYIQTKPQYFKKHSEDLKWWKLSYERRFDLFEKFLKSNEKTLLDIGSGPGFFLKTGQERGWSVMGIEPSIAATEYSKSLGVKVLNNPFEKNLVKKLPKFNVVHMQSVLEHLPNPKENLSLCYKLLKPGGLLCIIVANDFNPLQIILKNHLNFNGWWIVPSEHINYFNIKTISRLVKASKFQILEVITTFPMELFLLMGDNYVGNDKLGKICHSKRKAFEFALIESGNSRLKDRIYKSFAKNNIGRDIEIIAKRD